MFTKLSATQIDQKIKFIHQYMKAENSATASQLDPNSNVGTKNVCTLAGEIHKDFNIQIKRAIISQKIEEIFGKEVSEEYLRQIQNHEIYVHDESNLLNPYCASVTLYPFLLRGMEGLGGEAKAPKHLSSFCGNFVNLCFALSAQLAGALSTVDFLNCFDYFTRKDFGEDYTSWFTNPQTEDQKIKAKEIENQMQSVVYALNQPAMARSYQSIFWNISVFDEHYFKAVYEGFVFPDFSSPNWESLDKLQRFFMTWFNKERTKALLTFPVVTASILTENGKPKDEEFSRFLAKELSEGNAFFLFMSKNPHAISSCCRLSNEMTDTSFSSEFGAGGVSTGSLNVITMNINRIVQDATKGSQGTLEEKLELIKKALEEQTLKIHKYQIATKAYYKSLLDSKMLPIYDAGFLNMKKQYLTVGINGVLEGAEFLGLHPSPNKEYEKYLEAVFKTIKEVNENGKREWVENEVMFNLEMVPAENLGVKFASWDKKDGYSMNRDIYNSYLYIVEDVDITLIEKFKLYRGDISKYLDGGSALHYNCAQIPSSESYYKLMCIAAKLHVSFWTTNIMSTACEEGNCGYINKETKDHCIKCGSKNIYYATRVIGYLRPLKSWNKERREKDGLKRSWEPINRIENFFE